MSEEKRKLGDYEIIQSIYIGDKEVVFGVDKKDPYPFMVCCCEYGKGNVKHEVHIYHFGISSNSTDKGTYEHWG